jgi:hypothetical protein
MKILELNVFEKTQNILEDKLFIVFDAVSSLLCSPSTAYNPPPPPNSPT